MQLIHSGRLARAACALWTILAPSFAFAADLFVTSINDSGAGSLRAAIAASNASAGTLDTIKFSIPGTGVHTIAPTSEFAAITDAVVIDGYTQTGAQENTALLNQSANMILKIELDGTNAPFGSRGLVVTNPGSPPIGTKIRGLAINRFTGSGIELRTGGVTIEGCLIGTDITGTIKRGNNEAGVKLIAGGIPTLIGGTTPAARNIISGNTFQSILFEGVFAQNGLVQGNFIGTDITGTLALGSNQFGINIHNGSFNAIGGTAAGAGNVISGNILNGIFIQGVGSGNTVTGNLLGTNNAGTAALPNGTNGIEIDDAIGSIVGGTAAGAGNLLSGNGFGGINTFRAKNTVIQGNKIGTNLAGTLALPNSNAGVILQQTTTGTLVGGTTSQARNIISGNNLDGITIFSGATGTRIEGNYIGTDATGLAPLGNKYSGIAIFGPNNTVGGADPAARNVICSNGLFGVAVQTNISTNNLIQGNYIGLGADGSTPLGNTGTTIAGTGQGVFIENAANNGVYFNVISSNHNSGIFFQGAASNNFIRANVIGVNPDSTAARPNLGAGIVITGTSSNNAIGGAGPGDGNVIAANTDRGVDVVGGTGNSILGNAIAFNGGIGIDLGEDGATPNDDLDNDGGPNGRQNFPFLTGVHFGGSVTITGVLSSKTNTAYRLEFFANTIADSTGFGQGELFLGSKNVTTDGQGTAPFSAVFNVAVGARRLVSCTATDPNGNTSEFSNTIGPSAADSAWLLYP